MDDDVHGDLKAWMENLAEKIRQATLFIQIFTDDYAKSADSMIQFTLALMLGKPIFLLVPRGAFIPEKILKVADGIAYFDPENPEEIFAVTKRILEDAGLQKK